MTQRAFWIAVAVVLGLAPAAFAAYFQGQAYAPAFTPQWLDAGPGAGGNVTDITIYPDGFRIARTDTNMYYFWKNASPWIEQPSPPSLSSVFLTSIEPYLYPGGGTEIGACAYTTSSATTLVGSTQIVYALFGNELFKTTNQGATWTDTGKSIASTGGNATPVSGGGPWIWCDPQSSGQVVYVSAQTGALQRSADGGNTWGTVSGLPAATSNEGTEVVGDPGSSIVSGVTQGVYFYVQGSGLYHSTNGGATASLVSGGPTGQGWLYIDKFSQIFVSGGFSSNSIYKYASGSWTTLSPGAGNGTALAIDPTSASAAAEHLVSITTSGDPTISANGGSSWAGPTCCVTANPTADVPWLGTAYQQSAGVTYFSASDIAFDAAGSTLYEAAGYGVWYIPSPQTGGVATAQSAGIEQLVQNRFISAAGLGPTFLGWDRAVFGDQLPGTYAAANTYPNNTILIGAWDGAYVPGTPTMMVAIVNGEGGGDQSAVSTDGGNTWTPWASVPPGGGTGNGGMIAAASATNWIAIDDDSTVPYCTTNGGGSWSAISFPGSPPNDWLNIYYLKRFILAADWVNSGVLYAYDAASSGSGGGLFSSSGGCAGTWSKVYSGYIDTNSSYEGFSTELEAVPGEAGQLFFTNGQQNGAPPGGESLFRSINGGASWTAVPNVLTVSVFGFGAAKPGGGAYPAIYINGYVDVAGTYVYGNWQSVDNAATWTALPAWPLTTNQTSGIIGDPDVYGRVYVGLSGGGYGFYDTSDACPWVGFTSPNPTANVTGTVSVSAVHTGLVPVTSVQFSVDGTNIGSSMTGNGPYAYSWATGGVAAGAHTLKVSVAGASCSDSKSIPITTH